MLSRKKCNILVGMLLLLLLVAGCKSAEQKGIDNLRSQGIPDYSIQLLMAVKDCNCQIDDTKRVTCLCSNPSWDKDVRFVCSQPPNDHYEALKYCFGTIQDKQ